MLNNIFSREFHNMHIIITLFNFIKIKIKTKNIKAYNNKIYVYTKDGIQKEVNINKIRGLSILINGSNNVVKIHEPYCFNNCKLLINGDNNLFESLSSIKSINNTTFNMQIKGDNRSIYIGKNCYIGKCLLINNKNNLSIKIDDDCMLSADIHIRTDDGHIICQKGTKNIINNGGNVTIGKHCWIGRNVFISKNVSLPENTIIGAGAIVTKSFNRPNIIIAGIPATIIKNNIEWYYNQQELEEKYNAQNLEVEIENKII